MSGRRLGVELVPVVFEKDVEHEAVEIVVVDAEVELEVELELVEVVLDVDVVVDVVVLVVLGVELVLDVVVVVGVVVDVVVGVVVDEALLDDGSELDDVVEAELDVLTEAGFVSRK